MWLWSKWCGAVLMEGGMDYAIFLSELTRCKIYAANSKITIRGSSVYWFKSYPTRKNVSPPIARPISLHFVSLRYPASSCVRVSSPFPSSVRCPNTVSSYPSVQFYCNCHTGASSSLLLCAREENSLAEFSIPCPTGRAGCFQTHAKKNTFAAAKESSLKRTRAAEYRKLQPGPPAWRNNLFGRFHLHCRPVSCAQSRTAMH